MEGVCIPREEVQGHDLFGEEIVGRSVTFLTETNNMGIIKGEATGRYMRRKYVILKMPYVEPSSRRAYVEHAAPELCREWAEREQKGNQI